MYSKASEISHLAKWGTKHKNSKQEALQSHWMQSQGNTCESTSNKTP